ncbi:MAG: hypothetical protein HEEMFOPI_02035 [Holosporales bacterium]
MKKMLSLICSIVSLYSNEQNQVPMGPNLTLISKMEKIRFEIGRVHFNDPIFNQIPINELALKFKIYKDNLNIEIFDNVINNRGNERIHLQLVPLRRSIQIYLSMENNAISPQKVINLAEKCEAFDHLVFQSQFFLR